MYIKNSNRVASAKASGVGKWMKGRIFSTKTRKKMSKSRIGSKLSEVTKQKIRKKLLGIKHTEERKINQSLSLRGKYKAEKSSNWKGGITPKNKIIRSSSEWREWRKKVFEKDDYTCQGCETQGIYLHPHHLISFAKSPETRFETWNGQTLCAPCHLDLHKQMGF